MAVLEKPHWGKSWLPFMKRRTGLSSTKAWSRSFVAGWRNSSSAMWRGATRASVVAVADGDLWTAKEAEVGANARAHDEEDRMPAMKRMERFMVDGVFGLVIA